MRSIIIPLEEILDLISCAEQYGMDDDVLYTSMFEYINPLTDEEIEEFAQTFLTEEAKERGYEQEDYENIKDKLIELRKDYA